MNRLMIYGAAGYTGRMASANAKAVDRRAKRTPLAG